MRRQIKAKNDEAGEYVCVGCATPLIAEARLRKKAAAATTTAEAAGAGGAPPSAPPAPTEEEPGTPRNDAAAPPGEPVAPPEVSEKVRRALHKLGFDGEPLTRNGPQPDLEHAGRRDGVGSMRAMATASGDGEASAPKAAKKKRSRWTAAKKKRSRWTVKQKSHDQKRAERRAREGGDGG